MSSALQSALYTDGNRSIRYYRHSYTAVKGSAGSNFAEIETIPPVLASDANLVKNSNGKNIQMRSCCRFNMKRL